MSHNHTTKPKQSGCQTLSSSKGFTIVELMIATMVFSVILLVITAGVLHFTTDYYKGVNSSTTQTVAANIMNRVAQSIQLGGIGDGSSLEPDSTADGNYMYFCVGSQQEFVYNLGVLDSPSTTKGLYVINLNGATCTDSPTAVTNLWNKRQDLLQPNMRIARLDTHDNGDGTWNVNVVVAFANGGDLLCDASSTAINSCTGSDTMLDTDIVTAAKHTDGNVTTNQLRCKSKAGSQFCSVVALSSTVQARLGN